MIYRPIISLAQANLPIEIPKKSCPELTVHDSTQKNRGIGEPQKGAATNQEEKRKKKKKTKQSNLL